MAKKHVRKEKVLKEHLDDPKKTGCVWRIPYFTWAQKRKAKRHRHSGLETSPSYCCNHRHNGFLECSQESRAKYHSKEYLRRLDAISVDYRKYHGKEGQTAEKAEKIRTRGTKQEGLRRWAENFTKDNWWDRYFQAAWGDPRYRLRTEPKGTDREQAKHSKAWKVGYEVEARLRRDPKYLGLKGMRLFLKTERSSVPMPPNHADSTVSRALGYWYPYPHNHHHIITIGKMKALLNMPKGDPESEATPQLRMYVIVLSRWNINGRENMLILPTDVTVGKVIELPAHTPWGARDHPKYSADVAEKLEPILQKLNEACDAAKGEKHEVSAKKAAGIARELREISGELRDNIESGAYGGQL